MLSFNDLLETINITTNGAVIAKHITTLEKMDKIQNINLSIDSLQKEKSFSKSQEEMYFLRYIKPWNY